MPTNTTKRMGGHNLDKLDKLDKQNPKFDEFGLTYTLNPLGLLSLTSITSFTCLSSLSIFRGCTTYLPSDLKSAKQKPLKSEKLLKESTGIGNG